ncbi:hypothetical protein QQZ08_010652 [Neonectria magnoliae]|uniref:Cytochrome P450 n=1 Tax=Neonectria magnoliae TaxID=2732573 RepID=A0ABR1HFH0_9HYPO
MASISQHLDGLNSVGTWAYSSVVLSMLWVVYCLLSSHLRWIPGPWYNRLTNLVLTFHTLRGRRIFYVDGLHKKYGPVVRISYSEVDVADVKGFKTIHKIGNGFLKHKWYKDFTKSPVEDVFSTLNPKIHASRRRVLNPALSPAALRTNWEWLVQDKIQKAVANLKQDALAGTGDAYKWLNLASSDVVGHIATGNDFGLTEAGEKTGFFEDLEILNIINVVRSVLGPAWPLARRFVRSFQDMADAEVRIHTYCAGVVRDIRERKGSKANVFTALIQEESADTDATTAFEVLGLILAGAGTTAITLAYLIWAVLKNPEVQQKLEDEVAQLEEGYNTARLKELPYLKAVIQESLRLYTAIPGGLQRVVPQSAPLQAAGHTIPPGSTVVTQAYTVHRNADLWPSPETFDPDRFLEANLKPEQKTALFPYGAGSRICLGMHLADVMMLHAVAGLFRSCKGLKLAETMSDSDMDFFNMFVIVPKGQKCEVMLR